jgi:hypothetical protein
MKQSNEQVVMKFVNGLRGKYSEYRRHYLNGVVEGIVKVHTSVSDVQREAEHHQPIQQYIEEVPTPKEQPTKDGTLSGATYVTQHHLQAAVTKVLAKMSTSQDKQGKLVFHTSSDAKGKKRVKANTDEDGEEEHAESTGFKGRYPCVICEKQGHAGHQCPYKEKVNTLIREGKISI